MTPAQASRFWTKVDKGESCWEWTAYRTRHGYGRYSISTDGRITTPFAHRVAFELTRGPIPEGLDLDHLCVNPPCVNPWHLEPVTNEENSRRAAERRATCGHGHPWVSSNIRIKPSRGVRECRACRREEKHRYRARVRAARREQVPA